MNQYTELLKCDLTDAEMADAARSLARANAQCASIEQQKKEVDSQLKAEIEAQKSIISRIAALITTGSEYRNIDCRVELDTPEPGKKTVVRLDTGEIVTVKPMTDSDRQMALDLKTQAEAEAEQEALEFEQITKDMAVDRPRGPIVTPPPVLQALPEPSCCSSDSVPCAIHTYSGTWKNIENLSDLQGATESATVAPAAVMGGTHQRKKRNGKGNSAPISTEEAAGE